ncbi:hypothetical protein SBV1_260063 [Verrucomicrobia bacterium]|nr:hypothetical protein SBV1_260063 [Verrucomicrobiota bacterium]
MLVLARKRPEAAPYTHLRAWNIERESQKDSAPKDTTPLGLDLCVRCRAIFPRWSRNTQFLTRRDSSKPG